MNALSGGLVDSIPLGTCQIPHMLTFCGQLLDIFLSLNPLNLVNYHRTQIKQTKTNPALHSCDNVFLSMASYLCQ